MIPYLDVVSNDQLFYFYERGFHGFYERNTLSTVVFLGSNSGGVLLLVFPLPF